MIDFSKWKESQAGVIFLKLDPLNPRIPGSGTELTQRDVVKDLIENEKILDLAKSIVESGYFPTEALITVEEEKKKYVVEGNRRLAALKLLISPEYAHSPQWERRFRALSNRISTAAIKKVKVIQAPSREAAAPIIMSRHTQKTVESWSPLMQAKFYRNLVEGGLAVDEIAEQYRIQPSRIAEALQRCMMYSVACSLDLPEDVMKKVQNPRIFPMSSLDRIYETKKACEFLGIEFDENRNLIGNIDIDEFKKGYSKVVADLAEGNVDSRKLNTIKEMDRYLKSFGEHTPNLSKAGSFTAETLVKSITKTATSTHTGAAKRKTKPKSVPQYALIPPACECDVNNQRINDVFNELRKLRVAQSPNAVGLMFRCLLEMSLGYHLDRTGHLIKMTDKARKTCEKKRQNLPADWHPTLREMLNYVTLEDSKIITNGNLLKALRKLIHQDHNLLSIDTLNLFVHNQHFYPNEEILRSFWSQLQGLFEIILTEPGPEDEAE